MHLLPSILAPVATFADQKDSGARWAVTGVQLELHDDGKFIACSTDTHRLLVVEGQTTHDSADYPISGQMVAAPNGVSSALIPHKFWTSVFTTAAKMNKRTTKPILKSLAVKLGEKEASFSATDLEKTTFDQTKYTEGRFPAWRSIMPSKPPMYRLKFDAKLMSEACATLLKLCPDTPDNAVYIDIWDHKKPIIITPMEYPEGIEKIRALLMPIFIEAKEMENLDTGARHLEAMTERAEDAERTVSVLRSVQSQLDDGHAESIREQNAVIAELRRDIAGMESTLLQVRMELNASREDLTMYHDREKQAAQQGV